MNWSQRDDANIKSTEAGDSASTEEKLERERQNRARDLIIASGRASFRTRGNIQLFAEPDVGRGDFESCLHQDSYQLWKCRGIE